jgi:hypothetical protein
MLTIFSIPKAFTDFIERIQINAIKSWLQLEPSCEVILFGDDPGVADTAKSLGVKHIPSIAKNEFGTPLLSSAFDVAQELAQNDTLMYVNSDIICFQHMIAAIKTVDFPRYLISGRRWDLDIQHEIDFSRDSWENDLLESLDTQGELHGYSGMDYFVFPRGSVDMLPFAVGRPGWDSWLVYDMRSRGVPVIDATKTIRVVHQNHGYSHSAFGRKKGVFGPEWEEHVRIAGGFTNMMTLRDADWVLTECGPERPSLPRRIMCLLSLWHPWRVMLAAKRRVQMMRGTK